MHWEFTVVLPVCVGTRKAQTESVEPRGVGRSDGDNKKNAVWVTTAPSSASNIKSTARIWKNSEGQMETTKNVVWVTTAPSSATSKALQEFRRIWKVRWRQPKPCKKQNIKSTARIWKVRWRQPKHCKKQNIKSTARIRKIRWRQPKHCKKQTQGRGAHTCTL